MDKKKAAELVINQMLYYGLGVQDLAHAMDQIAIVWSPEDVEKVVEYEHLRTLSREECFSVLKKAEDSHDANIGISWDVLGMHAKDMFGRKGPVF